MKFYNLEGADFSEKNIREDLNMMQVVVRIGSQATPTAIIGAEAIGTPRLEEDLEHA